MMRNMKRLSCAFLLAVLPTMTAMANPALEAKTGIVPVISDFDMQQCVKLFNKAEAEYQQLLAMPINEQDEKSVRKVRNQIELHSRMVEQFNLKCAGKQSQSSCEKTHRARTAQGLAYQDCRVTKAN